MFDAPSPFAALIGLQITALSKTEVRAELRVREALLNVNGVLHGGAIMALADIMGGSGTMASISAEQRTTTVESKTSFLRALKAGTTVQAVSTPLHQGGKTEVWQTNIYDENNRLAAQVTQTQIILEPRPEAS